MPLLLVWVGCQVRAKCLCGLEEENEVLDRRFDAKKSRPHGTVITGLVSKQCDEVYTRQREEETGIYGRYRGIPFPRGR